MHTNDATGSSVQSPGDESRGVVADSDDRETVRELLQPLHAFERRPLVQESVLLVYQHSSKTQLGVLFSDWEKDDVRRCIK